MGGGGSNRKDVQKFKKGGREVEKTGMVYKMDVVEKRPMVETWQ